MKLAQYAAAVALGSLILYGYIKASLVIRRVQMRRLLRREYRDMVEQARRRHLDAVIKGGLR